MVRQSSIMISSISFFTFCMILRAYCLKVKTETPRERKNCRTPSSNRNIELCELRNTLLRLLQATVLMLVECWGMPYVPGLASVDWVTTWLRLDFGKWWSLSMNWLTAVYSLIVLILTLISSWKQWYILSLIIFGISV